MNITVRISENKLYKAMENTEDAICNDWFQGDKDKYDEWAGDRVGDGFWTFITQLSVVANIEIETYQN